MNKLGELFLTVLNMSLTASYVILFVMLVRLLLKKAPKVISYVLWSVVAFRLVTPFSFESVFSLMPRNTDIVKAVPIPRDIIYQQSPKINSGIEATDSIINNPLPNPLPIQPAGASANPLHVYVEIGAYIWILAIIALLVYSFVCVLLLKRKLEGAQLIEKNIFEAKNLKTPFVLGLINPRIYLPAGLSKEELNYILMHEKTHIRRKDHIIKTLAFLIASMHWFNPLVWIAFMLMGRDMELSCDESVLKAMNEDIKKPYANSLLSLAAGRHILNGSPLAFGEGNVKGRIKNVLNYKKPTFWVVALSIIVIASVGTGLVTNPKVDKLVEQGRISGPAEQGNNSSAERGNNSSSPQTTIEPAASPKTTIEPAVSPQITIGPTVPELSPGQDFGASMPVLDYASDDIVIFHGYFGLFVYDLNKLQIISSIDLKPLDCHYTQGDNHCDVTVSPDGNTVHLHPMESENMYVYTVSNHTLQEAAYKPMEDSFKSKFVPIEEATKSIEPGNYSYHAVKFDNGEYGYLHASGWTLGTLSYVRGDKVYALFGMAEDVEAGKAKLDGYLADVTGIQDSYVAEIYVWGYVTHHEGFGNKIYLPLIGMRNNNIINDILSIINDKSLWQEKFHDVGSVRGQDYDISSIHVDFRMKSEKGSAFISLHINPVSHEISAECVWHPPGGKQITFLYSDNRELYINIIRRLFNINVEHGWRVSGNINNDEFICYSLKDKYSKGETLAINAVLINDGDEDITFKENIKAWIKLTGEQDYKLWEDIDVAMPANGVLRPGERLYLNLVQTDSEHDYFKPGTYTVEGEFGDYPIDGFRVIIE